MTKPLLLQGGPSLSLTHQGYSKRSFNSVENAEKFLAQVRDITISPKTIDFCGPSANPGPFGTSKSTAIFNLLATTPIDVRYRRHWHYCERLSEFYT
jgi:hypothetical protein